jgi:hypothetical protein
MSLPVDGLTIEQYMFQDQPEQFMAQLATNEQIGYNYWSNALNFVRTNRDKMFKTLTAKQQTWLKRVRANLIDADNERIF